MNHRDFIALAVEPDFRHECPDQKQPTAARLGQVGWIKRISDRRRIKPGTFVSNGVFGH